MAWSIFNVFAGSGMHRKMNKLTKQIFSNLRKDTSTYIEYGNIRRGKPWGDKDNDQIQWVYLIDLLSDRPLVFKIVYDLRQNKFICYSRSGGKNEMANVLQFSTTDFNELSAKLLELASQIPVMRERMLRQHIFSLAGEKSKKRWLVFFNKDNRDEEFDHLKSSIRSMLEQGKISEREADKLVSYAKNLSEE